MDPRMMNNVADIDVGDFLIVFAGSRIKKVRFQAACRAEYMMYTLPQYEIGILSHWKRVPYMMVDRNPEDLDVVLKGSSTSRNPVQPPPETFEGLHIRRLVIISFWAVAIVLGLPIWLWTTSIHRARLPLQEMLEWADGKVGLTLL